MPAPWAALRLAEKVWEQPGGAAGSAAMPQGLQSWQVCLPWAQQVP